MHMNCNSADIIPIVVNRCIPELFNQSHEIALISPFNGLQFTFCSPGWPHRLSRITTLLKEDI